MILLWTKSVYKHFILHQYNPEFIREVTLMKSLTCNCHKQINTNLGPKKVWKKPLITLMFENYSWEFSFILHVKNRANLKIFIGKRLLLSGKTGPKNHCGKVYIYLYYQGIQAKHSVNISHYLLSSNSQTYDMMANYVTKAKVYYVPFSVKIPFIKRLYAHNFLLNITETAPFVTAMFVYSNYHLKWPSSIQIHQAARN